MARFNTGKLEDALAIRDTDAHNSSSIDNPLHGTMLLVAQNGLNQSVSLQYEGSVDDGTTWHSLGSAQTVTASTGKNVQTLTDIWPKLRVVSTCSVAPASGSLTVFWIWRAA